MNDNFGKHASYDMIGYPMGTRWLKLNLNENKLNLKSFLILRFIGNSMVTNRNIETWLEK